MSELILGNEPTIRLAVFLGVFVLMALLELAAPRRPLTASKGRRWFANIAIVVVNTLALRLLFPVLATGVALWAEASGSGLLNLVEVPLWLAVVASLLALDFLIWAQHLVFHKVPWFWRLHRVHHTDTDIDVTTGARFHPVEIVLSMLIKMAAVALLGVPAVAVVIFEVVLNALAMFNHANLRLPTGLDRALRLVIVTPDVHRVHHSVRRYETDSNYGFNLTWWDRLFGTWRAQPEDGHSGMTIGLPEWRDQAALTLPRLMILPFRPTPPVPPVPATDR